MVAMGRAMIARPKLLLLDEPSMGLAPLMVEKVFEVVRTIASEGVTILLIEQNARLALENSHRGYVMESGEIILSGKSGDMLHDPKVRAAYLGEVEEHALRPEVRCVKSRRERIAPALSPGRERADARTHTGGGWNRPRSTAIRMSPADAAPYSA